MSKKPPLNIRATTELLPYSVNTSMISSPSLTLPHLNDLEVCVNTRSARAAVSRTRESERQCACPTVGQPLVPPDLLFLTSNNTLGICLSRRLWFIGKASDIDRCVQKSDCECGVGLFSGFMPTHRPDKKKVRRACNE